MILNTQIINIPLGPSIGQCCGGYAQVEITKHANGFESLINEKFLNFKFIDKGCNHFGIEHPEQNFNFVNCLNML